MGKKQKTKRAKSNGSNSVLPLVKHADGTSPIFEIKPPSVGVPIAKIEEIKQLCSTSKHQKSLHLSDIILSVSSLPLGCFISNLGHIDFSKNIILVIASTILYILYALCKRSEKKATTDMANTILNLLNDYSDEALNVVKASYNEKREIYNQQLMNGTLTDLERKEQQ